MPVSGTKNQNYRVRIVNLVETHLSRRIGNCGQLFDAYDIEDPQLRESVVDGLARFSQIVDGGTNENAESIQRTCSSCSTEAFMPVAVTLSRTAS